MENKITKSDLNKVFWRTQLIQMSHNYERMQSLGSLYCLSPVLKRIYKDAPKEQRVESMRRHLEYFNTHPMLAFSIFGIVAAMEENTTEEEKEGVIAVKTGLMGPLAGLGDSLLNFTWMPICGSIGAALAVQGNILGPILMFLMINGLYTPLKYYGLFYGYKKGESVINEKDEGTRVLDRLSGMANVLGVIVIGGLIAGNVKVKIGTQFQIGDQVLVLQEMLDKVMPNLLPVLVTVACYYLLKKSNGKYAVRITFGVLIRSVILSMFGILV